MGEMFKKEDVNSGKYIFIKKGRVPFPNGTPMINL
jgi:hypothetical protein